MHLHFSTALVPANQTPVAIRFARLDRMWFGLAFALRLPFGRVFMLDAITRPGVA